MDKISPDPSVIDPRLREVILELNERGLKTQFSCAGHNRWEGDTGEIVFTKTVPHGYVKEILQSHGLDVISMKNDSSPIFPKPRTIAYFRCLGGGRRVNKTDPGWTYFGEEPLPPDKLLEWIRTPEGRRWLEDRKRGS